ncbi:CopD family protein [Kineosporia sp. NBRC 101731]|uniref:copper resistance CopC/CopD family protein n=1 Tax=Kineosporia sp. NBRC 101731 TaxID=3032199 RepID=UPI0024A1CCA9|nr:CopD family protein [Kineosporia sp. NBRC 101731]GLY29401.1 hypothetical protein Kisp02_27660 [Kineosporia sp. NBRC 101731]
MNDRTATCRSPWPRRWLLLGLAVFASMMVAFPASAHLDLVSTTPADGTMLKNPSAAITVTFTKAATPSGKGFTLYNSAGRAVPVQGDTSDDGVTWKIRPTTALQPGSRYGLTWKVTGGDAHVKSGTITFRVAAAPAASPDDTVPSDSSSTSSVPASSDGPTDAGAIEATPESASDADDHAQMPGHTMNDPDTQDTQVGADLGTGPEAGLDAVLASADEEGSTLADTATAVARWMSYLGILVSVGALIVVITTLVGAAGDVRLGEHVVRWAAGLCVLGALMEGACLLWASDTPVPWSPALATGLRLAAGTAMVLTLELVPRSTGGRRSYDVPALPGAPRTRSFSAARGERPHGESSRNDAVSGTSRSSQLILTPPVRTGRVRGVPMRPALTAVIGTVMLVSFVFDGHTATVSPRLLIAIADLAHTTAAAVWVGGVVLLAVLLLVRARAGVPTGAGELAVRFSVPATAAVVVAGLAGTVLTLLIIDSPDDLTGTPWGRIMLIKLGLVAAVAVMGYANNRYALPALDSWRPGTARLLRRTVAAEATVMIAVLLITAILVASQT